MNFRLTPRHAMPTIRIHPLAIDSIETGNGSKIPLWLFGFIKMPGSFLVNAYPVILQWQDVLATIAGVALIGYIIALLPVRRNIR